METLSQGGIRHKLVPATRISHTDAIETIVAAVVDGQELATDTVSPEVVIDETLAPRLAENMTSVVTTPATDYVVQWFTPRTPKS